MFEKEIIIDGKGHIMGRLAAIVAKQLLCGQRIIVVRAEQLVLSGSLFRRKLDYEAWRRIKHQTNPKRSGPWHFKAPATLFWRAVRGMLPRKTKRGAAALERLKVFEGIPFPYCNKKRRVVPLALRAVRLAASRKSCQLGELSEKIGWNNSDLVKRLEEKREKKAQEYWNAKVKVERAIKKEVDAVALVKDLRTKLSELGY